MNTDLELLFHLDIPLDYQKKLSRYYYIPENRIQTLRTGGFIYLIDKYTSNKKLHYFGILTKIDVHIYCKQNEPITIQNVLDKYHLFYRPKINKMESIIQLLSK